MTTQTQLGIGGSTPMAPTHHAAARNQQGGCQR